jgi:hypothetical protein
MKTCPHCNNSCEDNDIVCTNCGYLFSADNIPAQSTQPGAGSDDGQRPYQPYQQQVPPQQPQQPDQQQYQQPQGQPQQPDQQQYQQPQGQPQQPDQQQYQQPQGQPYQSPYQQQQYQQPYQPYNCPPPGPDGFRSAPAATKTSGTAVASFVLGIIALLSCWCFGFGIVLAIPGLILAIVSLKKFDSDPTLTGHGYAVAGLVINIIALLLCVLFIFEFVVFFQSDAGKSMLQQYSDIYNKILSESSSSVG